MGSLRPRYAMKRFGKADATRTQSVAYGLSFRAYAIGRRPRYAIASILGKFSYSVIS
ncbi:MAG: hypothetical protein F6J90_10880 [Moorea sp. SIOASIH]|uniref:hypothetical protein n=1 Tax=Moorena sp. SIOASIH TaxID=2607817 RepID=UPI0013B63FA9|nr:hypothetical protein [Moorena sp. SIOASIH]NEO36785.1 hypothetical protein [Moorena sp. SIOASIH]